MKGSVDTTTLRPVGLGFYGGLCGWALARAHARTGDAVAIAAYLGTSDTFDGAIADFAETYADVNATRPRGLPWRPSRPARSRCRRPPAERGRIALSYEDALDLVVRAFEVLGVAILAIGSAASIVGYLRDLGAMGRTQAYKRLRTNIGRTILLGLEVLIVADIVLTVAIDQTIESAISLGIIVLVRTFLSFSLEIELEGVVPWHRKAVEAGTEA